MRATKAKQLRKYAYNRPVWNKYRKEINRQLPSHPRTRVTTNCVYRHIKRLYKKGDLPWLSNPQKNKT